MEKDNKNTEQLYVIYALYIGKTADNDNIYHFLISNDYEETWAEGWENKPACIMRNLTPDDDMYDYIVEIRTEIKLDLAQNNCCFSMQDCRDHVVALASENLEDADVYPDNGRIVVQFGDPIEDVEKMLAKRDIAIEYV